MSVALKQAAPEPQEVDRAALAAFFARTRAASHGLVAGLKPEDMVVQSMTDASPTKWHLAHTTWFFETFVLAPHLDGYNAFDPAFAYLFNSYYEAAGPRHPRPRRGMLTRPSVDTVLDYRRHVDGAMDRLMTVADTPTWEATAPLITLGSHHEMQHQELLLTDLLHAFSCNPTHPAYHDGPVALSGKPAAPIGWINGEGGVYSVGHAGPEFAFDCEGPRHEVLLQPFRLATRPVTNGEWLEFMADGGYRRAELWLSDGWMTVQEEGWTQPFYWERHGDDWHSMTLSGLQPVDPAAPACHISFYEADAYACWAGKRLPTEAELEVAVADRPIAGNFMESDVLRPLPAADDGGMQLYGDVWEWTQSSYSPYPGFRPPDGAIGEYNGKFMCNQLVLRGGSCVTPTAQLRASYRTFFYPHQRWQFTGLRLAEDV